MKLHKENLEKYEAEISRLEELMGEFSTVQAETEASTNSLTEAENKASVALGERKERIDEIIEKMMNLPKTYEEAKDAALDSINTQIGLFDELVLSSEYSAEKIIENWASQQAAFVNYSTNLQKAIDLGLDQVLVGQLSDGSTESMAILDALVNDTEVNVDDINAAFAGLSDSKDSLAGTIAQVRLLADPEFAALADDAREAGVYTIEGLIDGVESMADAFEESMRGIGRRGMKGYNEEMDIHSPAGKMIPSGEYTVEGAIIGVEKMAGAFEDAMSGLAMAGADAFLSNQLDRVAAYPSIVPAPTSYSRSVAHHYGGFSFTIQQQPGESPEILAHRVMDIIQSEIMMEEASFGG